MDSLDDLELSPDELRTPTDPDRFAFETTDDLEALRTVIGQDRAVRAIRFGIDVPGRGFNLFVSGVAGTGKTTTVRRLLDRLADERPVPPDRCFVQNFSDPERPRILTLEAGRGCRFVEDMERLVQDLGERVPEAFEGEEFEELREKNLRKHQEEKKELLQEMREKAEERGFELRQTPVGFQTIPVKDGERLTQDEYEALDEEAQADFDRRMAELEEEIQDFVSRIHDIDHEIREEENALKKEMAQTILEPLMRKLRDEYADHETVLAYLDEVAEDVVENVEDFLPQSQEQQRLPAPLRQLQGGSSEPDLTRYEVNLVVDNCDQEGAPVIHETHPTYQNVIGRIERKAQFGALFTDFTLIRAGSLARAHGGFLVLRVEDVLKEPFVYDALKRALQDRELRIEDLAERVPGLQTKTIQPQAIPLETKVVLIGSPIWYHLLFAHDEEFRKIFKVKADFSDRTDRTDDTVDQIAAFVARMNEEEEELLPFTPDGVAALCDESSRLVEDREKLSLRFSDVADLVRETAYWAVEDGDEVCTGEHVQRAIDEGEYRASLVKQRVHEMIERDILRVDSEGDAVGQINGLSIHMLGNYRFGRPTRITANVGLGRDGVVNVERKANLSHATHDKGVLILSGFLTERFATDRPIALSATLAFEQSYAEIAGDSASSTELYALLSALSGLPLRQDVAVTGSVDQKGAVQAIGGVNRKIEGFFDVCEARGLTGDQGVLIPGANVQHLMLRPRVVHAVQEGRFHIWSVDHVDEGIELLTGVEAGIRDDEGEWTEGSVNARVAERLATLGEALRSWGQEAGPAAEVVRPSRGEEPGPPTPPGPPEEG